MEPSAVFFLCRSRGDNMAPCSGGDIPPLVLRSLAPTSTKIKKPILYPVNSGG